MAPSPSSSSFIEWIHIPLPPRVWRVPCWWGAIRCDAPNGGHGMEGWQRRRWSCIQKSQCAEAASRNTKVKWWKVIVDIYSFLDIQNQMQGGWGSEWGSEGVRRVNFIFMMMSVLYLREWEQEHDNCKWAGYCMFFYYTEECGSVPSKNRTIPAGCLIRSPNKFVPSFFHSWLRLKWHRRLQYEQRCYHKECQSDEIMNKVCIHDELLHILQQLPWLRKLLMDQDS